MNKSRILQVQFCFNLFTYQVKHVIIKIICNVSRTQSYANYMPITRIYFQLLWLFLRLADSLILFVKMFLISFKLLLLHSWNFSREQWERVNLKELRNYSRGFFLDQARKHNQYSKLNYAYWDINLNIYV